MREFLFCLLAGSVALQPELSPLGDPALDWSDAALAPFRPWTGRIWRLVFAFFIGTGAATCYLVALWVGLVGNGETLGRFLTKKLEAESMFFPRLWLWRKQLLFAACGGFVALVFQIPEEKLAAVQAFIIGCSWPSIVSNYLSGRQADESRRLENQVISAAQALRTINEELDGLDELSEPAVEEAAGGSLVSGVRALLEQLEPPADNADPEHANDAEPNGPQDDGGA